MNSKKTVTEDFGASLGSVALPTEPGLYWAIEFSPRPTGMVEIKRRRIIEISGTAPWLRMKTIYPLPMNDNPNLELFTILGPLRCPE